MAAAFAGSERTGCRCSVRLEESAFHEYSYVLCDTSVNNLCGDHRTGRSVPGRTDCVLSFSRLFCGIFYDKLY